MQSDLINNKWQNKAANYCKRLHVKTGWDEGFISYVKKIFDSRLVNFHSLKYYRNLLFMNNVFSKLLLILIIMPLILQGCGRKGDLYLPQEKIPVKQNQVGD